MQRSVIRDCPILQNPGFRVAASGLQQRARLVYMEFDRHLQEKELQQRFSKVI